MRCEGAQRVDERHGVGARRLGGPRGRGHIGRVGRELDDQRLGRERAHAGDDGAQLGRVGPDVQPGLDVRAGHVELQRVDLVAILERLDEGRELLGGGAHDVGDERHGQRGELGQVVRQVALQALVGQPDRVDQPGRRLVQPRRRVALAGVQRDRLGHECAERELLEQGVAERSPGGDRVERARPVDDRVGERQAEELGQCAGTSARRSASSTGPSTHRRT
jgi:hypothetical protein